MVKKSIKVQEQYICGLGEIIFGAVEHGDTKIQGLQIGKIAKQIFGSDVESEDGIYDNTIIWFHNKKGLNALQKVLDEIRIRL